MSDLSDLIRDAIEESMGSLREKMVVEQVHRSLESANPCGNPDHRIQPTDATDWKAVDNMVLQVLYSYIESNYNLVSALWHLLNQACERTGAEVSKERLAELEGLQIQAAADSCVLQVHAQLINKSGRGFTAQAHYGDIINLVEAYFNQENKDGEEVESRKADRPNLRSGQIH